MRCVDWAAEYLDGQIVVALLRAEGFHAHLFDQYTMRQDWFQILAYGGFRVMVPASQLDAAHALTRARRQGALTLADEPEHRPLCPRCRDARGQSDSRPRRRAFAAYLVWSVVTFALATRIEAPVILVAAFAPWLAMLVVPLWRHGLVGRYRCAACSHRWRAAAEPFAQLRDAAEAAGA